MTQPARPIVEMFFDFASTYSYLAATQIESVAARAGAEVRWRPMVLGAVFKATGNDMPARVPAKAAYMVHDLERWAKRYGIPFKMSPYWPMPTVAAERLCLVADEHGLAGPFALATFAAVWAEGRDINQPDELVRLAGAVGLDPKAALERAQSPEIKDRLRANTDEAVRRGAFGAPAIFVGDELFWGNDRLHFVEEALAARSARDAHG
jgi:2-hydroxychromene-2-carboxylate isomerase